jgi:hypothetical protein
MGPARLTGLIAQGTERCGDHRCLQLTRQEQHLTGDVFACQGRAHRTTCRFGRAELSGLGRPKTSS